jgi:hypothetical protein
MKKQIILLFASAFVSMFLLFSLANAQLILDDDFKRTEIAPWTKFISPPCSAPTTDVSIAGNEFLRHTYAANCLAWAQYRLSTYVNDFEWNVSFWVSWSERDVLIMEWVEPGVGVVSIRFNRDKNLLEFDTYYGSIMNFQTRTYPDWATTYSVPFYFGAGGQTFDFTIRKVGSNIKVYRTDGGVELIADWTSPLANVRALDINLARYNPSVSSYSDLDRTKFYSLTTLKGVPNITISVTPAYNVSYGTEQMISCIISPPTIPITLYYFTTPVANPYRATLPIGTHYWRCESNETDDYYASYTSTLTWVYGAVTTTTTVPSPIPNVSQPIPQLVNETEWREAGYGWALIFVSPIGLVTMFTLLISSIVARFAGMSFGIVSFLFIWFVLVMFTGLLPSWLFLVLIIIAGFIVMQIARGIIAK